MNMLQWDWLLLNKLIARVYPYPVSPVVYPVVEVCVGLNFIPPKFHHGQGKSSTNFTPSHGAQRVRVHDDGARARDDYI